MSDQTFCLDCYNLAESLSSSWHIIQVRICSYEYDRLAEHSGNARGCGRRDRCSMARYSEHRMSLEAINISQQIGVAKRIRDKQSVERGSVHYWIESMRRIDYGFEFRISSLWEYTVGHTIEALLFPRMIPRNGCADSTQTNYFIRRANSVGQMCTDGEPTKCPSHLTWRLASTCTVVVSIFSHCQRKNLYTEHSILKISRAVSDCITWRIDKYDRVTVHVFYLLYSYLLSNWIIKICTRGCTVPLPDSCLHVLKF